MAFDSLSEKLNHVFSKMREKGKLTDLEIKQAMREIRIALLEADVNFQVVRDFINRVSEKASGEDILKGLNSTQQVIKIVNDELIALMGSTHSKLAVADRPPTIIMMCGLQGAGKTTMCGKHCSHMVCVLDIARCFYRHKHIYNTVESKHSAYRKNYAGIWH